MHISVLHLHIDYRRGSSSELGRESSLVEVDPLYHICIENRKESQEVSGLIERDIVQEVKIIVACAAPDIDSG